MPPRRNPLRSVRDVTIEDLQRKIQRLQEQLNLYAQREAEEYLNEDPPLVEEEIDEEEEEVIKENGNQSQEDYIAAGEGELLVLRRLLHQHKEETKLRHSIFRTRCTVGGKVCSVIVDSGSCENVVATLMVEKLCLPTEEHPRPYKLSWIQRENEVEVTRRCLVNFSIGKFCDQVWCDVVPMDACHLLLGRPWQFDRRTIYDGKANTYSFDYEGAKVSLLPMKEDKNEVQDKSKNLAPNQVSMEIKREACGVWEAELKQREQQIIKIENSVKSELHTISDEHEDVMKKLQILEEKGKFLHLTEKTVETKWQDLEKEKKEISKMREELLKEKISLEDEYSVSSIIEDNETRALSSAPILAPPIFSLIFEVECDTSNLEIGAVLQHNGHLQLPNPKYSLEGKQRSEKILKFHQQVSNLMANVKKKVTPFKVGDWLWMRLRKERFPQGSFSKLKPKVDGSFRILKKINDNSYQINLPGNFNISTSFNVADLISHYGPEVLPTPGE